MKSISGRIHDLQITGNVVINGISIDPKDTNNPVAYVPQEDHLIGELTTREVTAMTANLKRNENRQVIDRDVQKLIDNLGLSHVADNIIGTLLIVSIK